MSTPSPLGAAPGGGVQDCLRMCAQCMVTATVAVGTATGVRAWAAARRPRWLTAPRLTRLTGGLLALALVAAGVSIG